MITKIGTNDYLKRFSSMTLTEKQEYLENVVEWNKNQPPTLLRHTADSVAQFQNIIQCGSTWNDNEQKAVSDGIKLLTAFAGSDGGWLPDAVYVKSAKRAIRWICSELHKVASMKSVEGEQAKTSPSQPTKAESVTRDSGFVKHVEKKKVGRPKKEEMHNVPTDAGTTETPQREPVRPRHIDQYVHLLPKKTQERAAMVKDLLQQEEVARENARLLMNDPKSSADDRAKWASLATKCDKAVREIYKELDAEWDKLVKSGHIIVDDLGNVKVVKPEEPKDTEEEAETPASSKGQAATRRALRKWLGDTRRGNGNTREEHVKKWKETYKEYLKIEGSAAAKDSKIIAAAKHYGIKLSELSK
ncbi:MAG: hypothetical protein IKQ37_07035 [Bacteroidaceae bacterium]|nr:hypothetical protein [Bacteroidaceae bacterium]